MLEEERALYQKSGEFKENQVVKGLENEVRNLKIENSNLKDMCVKFSANSIDSDLKKEVIMNCQKLHKLVERFSKNESKFFFYLNKNRYQWIGDFQCV